MIFHVTLQTKNDSFKTKTKWKGFSIFYLCFQSLKKGRSFDKLIQLLFDFVYFPKRLALKRHIHIYSLPSAPH